MSSSIVAFRDEERSAAFHDHLEILTPIVGTDCLGPSAVLGVGYIKQSTGEVTVYGDTGHHLIRAWRALSVFKRFPEMNDPIAFLRACWTIADPELDLESKAAKLALELLGGVYSSPTIRARVPPLLILEDMVAHLHDGRVLVDLSEIKNELRLGRLADTARLRQLMTRIERDRLTLISLSPSTTPSEPMNVL